MGFQPALLRTLASTAAGLRARLSGSPEEALLAPYRYDRRRPPLVSETELSSDRHRLSQLTFTKSDGVRHNGLFLCPGSEGPVPCVLLLHALTSDKETMVRLFGEALAERGIASLALDAYLHGERKADTVGRPGPVEYLELARETIVEYRQALDHLEARGEIDPGRVGLLGYSMGAMTGAILAGVDDRIGASALLAGGDVVQRYRAQVPAVLRGLVDSASPAQFVGRISPRPLLFVNGLHDHVVTPAAARLLHGAAGEPKEIRWVNAAHLLPPECGAAAVDWLVEHLTGTEGPLEFGRNLSVQE